MAWCAARAFTTDRIEHMYRDPHEAGVSLRMHYGDLNDGSSELAGWPSNKSQAAPSPSPSITSDLRRPDPRGPTVKGAKRFLHGLVVFAATISPNRYHTCRESSIAANSPW